MVIVPIVVNLAVTNNIELLAYLRILAVFYNLWMLLSSRQLRQLGRNVYDHFTMKLVIPM